jgi:hypothetical protein
MSLTLAWNDPAAALNATHSLVNDLDVELEENSTHNIIYPWILNAQPDPDSLSSPATHGIDTLNNVERIDLESPLAGDYTIRISGQKMKTASTGFFPDVGDYSCQSFFLDISYRRRCIAIGNQISPSLEIKFFQPWQVIL